MKRFLILMLCLAMLVPVLCGCGKQEKEEPTKMLSFSQAQSVEEMQTYDGQKVTIIGYMSTLSPISGDFMYLMNLPYQSCPFCVPNTTQLSNTMAVYAKDGQEFEFTDSAIQVTGVMEFGDYTDEFGYEYSYRIKDAEFSEVDTSDMSEKLKLWQQLASTDVISDVYSMYEYLNFLCYWPSYTAAFGDGEDYLYPTDALHFIQDDGAQYTDTLKDISTALSPRSSRSTRPPLTISLPISKTPRSLPPTLFPSLKRGITHRSTNTAEPSATAVSSIR